MKRISGVLIAGVAILAAGANAQYAYVANLSGNSMSVINLATNTVTATVSVGTTPYGVAVNPAGTIAYVANYNTDNLSVINASTNTLTASVKIPQAYPYGVAVNPNGQWVYVTNYGSDNVSVINTSTNVIAATVTVGVSPEGIAVNPAGTFAYVANYNTTSTTVTSGTVSVIDLSSYAVTSVTVGNAPRGIAINPAGTYVYVSNNNDGTVSVINTGNNTVSSTITVGNGPRGIAITPDGTQVWVANNTDNTVSVIGAAGNTVIATLAVGNGPVGIAINPSGSFAYVTNTVDNTVSVINTASQNKTATITVGANPTGIAIGGPQPLSINAGGILNGASYAVNAPVAPGSLVSVFGNFPVSAAQAASTPLPATLSGLSMQFNAVQAPFYYASATQANVQVPWELAAQTQASVAATVGGDTGTARQVSLASAAPGIFTMNAQGQGAIVNQAGVLVNSSSPATAGSTYVLIYCTGLGPVSNQPATGGRRLDNRALNSHPARNRHHRRCDRHSFLRGSRARLRRALPDQRAGARRGSPGQRRAAVCHGQRRELEHRNTRRPAVSAGILPNGTCIEQAMPETVKIVRFHKTGGPEVLQIDELPLPEPAPGQVRLRVKAIGLNRAEVMFRMGRYLVQPVLPSKNGYEASGTVEAVGRRDHQDRSVHLRRTRDHVLHVVRMARAIHVRVVPRLALVLHVRRRNRDPARSLLRRLVNLIVRLEFTAKLLGHHLGQGCR